MDESIEGFDQPPGHDGAHATRWPQQDVGTEQHHGPNDIDRQRIAHAGHVAENQIALKLIQLRSRDPHIREAAEPGVDAVDNLTGFHEPLDGSARLVGTCGSSIIDVNGNKFPRHPHHIGHREGVTGQDYCIWHEDRIYSGTGGQ